MERWAGKVAVVTGASSGIGEAVVRDLVSRGIKVAALARRIDRLKKLESELSGKGTIVGLQCDVGVEEDINKAFEWIEKNWGAVHIMINNAGYFVDVSVSELDSTKLKQMFDTNIVGLTICMSRALKSMMDHKILDGHVININSVAGHGIIPFKGVGIYSATKYGVTAITEYVRREMGEKKYRTKVTSISPGLVKTEMTQGFMTKVPAEIPYLVSEDVSNAVVFALSTPPNVNISELTIQPVGEGANPDETSK
ncbi:hypothetical protein AAG570_003542 [Ranatra chinensis]|uniref:Farnesol dehydrogenase n=1 Tax=Ranatra chinensis TaxID=642074 RepID=A0ABD0YIE6_9HEMI